MGVALNEKEEPIRNNSKDMYFPRNVVSDRFIRLTNGGKIRRVNMKAQDPLSKEA